MAQKMTKQHPQGSRHPLVLTFYVDLEIILIWDQCHWKSYLIAFSCIGRTFKIESICDMGAHFTADCSWVRDEFKLDVLDLQLHLDSHAILLRWWPKERISLGILQVFSTRLGHALAWARVPRLIIRPTERRTPRRNNSNLSWWFEGFVMILRWD